MKNEEFAPLPLGEKLEVRGNIFLYVNEYLFLCCFIRPRMKPNEYGGIKSPNFNYQSSIKKS